MQTISQLTEMDKNGQKQTETERNGQKRKETDRNGQKRIETDRGVGTEEDFTKDCMRWDYILRTSKLIN